MVSAVQEVIINFCLNTAVACQTLVFLVEYEQNTTSIQGHIRIAISKWVGLHPHASLMIAATTVLPT